MAVLVMPLLAGGRDLAAGFIKLLGPIDDGRVVLNANSMSHASTSFTRQLVRSSLVDRRAAELVVVGGPADFVNDVKTVADELGVADRVQFAADDPELYPGAASVIVAPDRGSISTPR
jgi:hypothetical protein